MLAKFSRFNPKGPYVSLEKEKETFCVVVAYSVKWAREIRRFHVSVVQRLLRNVQKKGDARAKLLFCSFKPIRVFWRSRYCHCHRCLISPLLLSSRNLATMVT